MKKIYTFLALITYLIPTICMQKERPQQAISDEIPLQIIQSTPPKILCTANQTNWQQLNKIMVADYTNTANLEPIYKTKTEQLEEQQLLLKTIKSKEPNPEIVKQLFDSVDKIRDTKHYGFIVVPEKLVTFIANMQKAKNNNIDEDIMMQFSYDRFNKSCSTEREIFTFCYLKKYTQTVNATQETLPTINDLYKKRLYTIPTNNLAKILNIPTTSITTTHLEYDSHAISLKYPAFEALRYSFCEMNNLSEYKINLFIQYVFNTHQQRKNKYLHWSCTSNDLKNKLNNKIENLIGCSKNEFSSYTLYQLLKIIDAWKIRNPQKEEKDLSYEIIDIRKPQNIINKFFSSEMYKFDENRILVLFLLIQKYNKERATKITPRRKQFDVYQIIPSKIALPNIFDKTLFDKKIYAFDELKNLIDNVKTLLSATNEHIQEIVDYAYPIKKNNI